MYEDTHGLNNTKKASKRTMARKRQQKNRSRQPKVRSMEHLLKTGEEQIYGQLCWSMGNRGTSIPRAGKVITLVGQQSNGEPAERKLRLTEQSTQAINQCLGMRTCGEAVSIHRSSVPAVRRAKDGIKKPVKLHPRGI